MVETRVSVSAQEGAPIVVLSPKVVAAAIGRPTRSKRGISALSDR